MAETASRWQTKPRSDSSPDQQNKSHLLVDSRGDQSGLVLQRSSSVQHQRRRCSTQNVEVGLCWHCSLSFENIWSSLRPLLGTDPWDSLSWETKTCEGASKHLYFFFLKNYIASHRKTWQKTLPAEISLQAGIRRKKKKKGFGKKRLILVLYSSIRERGISSWKPQDFWWFWKFLLSEHTRRGRRAGNACSRC